MTNKEAIEYIKNGARCNGDCEYCEKCTEVKYRQALDLAIKALEDGDREGNCVLTIFGKCSYSQTGCSDCEIKDEIRKALNDRPQGEWKHNNFDEHYCNKCGNFALWSEEADGYYEVQSNFCPNCGRPMKKGGAV